MNDPLNEVPPTPKGHSENMIGTLAGQGGKEFYNSKALYDA